MIEPKEKRLIAIEGTDGSGKKTQAVMLAEELRSAGVPVRQLSFPCYESDSSALVRMYLSGAFGTDPSAVNAYAASTFFAVDRYASFMQDWKEAYDRGDIIITDRYTTSNVIHQASKLPEGEQEFFTNWLYDMEYSKLGIPKPDVVIYLDVPTEVSAKNREKREAAGESKADIHEKDDAYLRHCRERSLSVAKKNGWHVVNCASGGEMLSPEEIHKRIMDTLDEAFADISISAFRSVEPISAPMYAIPAPLTADNAPIFLGGDVYAIWYEIRKNKSGRLYGVKDSLKVYKVPVDNIHFSVDFVDNLPTWAGKGIATFKIGDADSYDEIAFGPDTAFATEEAANEALPEFQKDGLMFFDGNFPPMARSKVQERRRSSAEDTRE